MEELAPVQAVGDLAERGTEDLLDGGFVLLS